MKLTSGDKEYIHLRGQTPELIQQQYELLSNGIRCCLLKRAAVIGDGILQVSEEAQRRYIEFYENQCDAISISKFVPASGAASRMFKSLFKFLDCYKPKTESINAFVNRTQETDLSVFFVGLEKLPFYKSVMKHIPKFYPDYHSYGSDKQMYLFVKCMLDTDKLNYGSFPKGLLPFHQYKDHVASAFVEHLFEASLYASSNAEAHLHFTVSEQHKTMFEEKFEVIRDIVKEKTNTKFNLHFSFQQSQTDTIVFDKDNQIMRDEQGQLLFRPSGHGALLSNLNAIDADVIFVKNIDNVVVYKYEKEMADYKKMLAGILLQLQSETFEFLRTLENDTISDDKLVAIALFLETELQVKISPEFKKYSKTYQIEYLVDQLNRPMRVCGMVKNEGEPGGGPFWVKDEQGRESLQIVEMAQIDKTDRSQQQLLKDATHFNPVDLVCGIKDYNGQIFDLNTFVDVDSGFVTHKTVGSQEIKVLELPGLWNGSMAGWISVFIEVPLHTFNPVKTVNDLLKPMHQIK